MPQPEDILNDYRKARRELGDKNRIPDRFGDDVDQPGFWVKMSEILARELRKALKESSQ